MELKHDEARRGSLRGAGREERPGPTRPVCGRSQDKFTGTINTLKHMLMYNKFRYEYSCTKFSSFRRPVEANLPYHIRLNLDLPLFYRSSKFFYFAVLKYQTAVVPRYYEASQADTDKYRWLVYLGMPLQYSYV